MIPAIDRPDLGFRWVDREDGAEGVLLTVEIPSESPAFRGHFPGRPILPAVAQLALVEQGIARLAGADSARSPAIVEISGLRLRRTVGPGDSLTLRLGAANPTGMHRFEIRSGDASVSGGSVRAGADEATGGPNAPTAETDFDAVPEISALGRVPHFPPALLIESLVAHGPSGALGRGVIPADSPFAVAGYAPSYLGLEMAAQTAALVEGLGREGRVSAPRIGYVVAIRRAQCFVRSLPVGQPLDVVVFFVADAPPLSIYDIRVEQEGRVRVEGTISTWIAEGNGEGES
jgi:3-hydroxymyristoyl/3-hydroxydecanoyl-(acyl carrier protein) dehydratase/predicted hotdog family 3-hydroxylacyl-ACP dehydratase